MQEQDFKSLNFTVVGLHSKLEGDLKFSGDTLINGEINGSITMESTGKLTLERQGRVEGTIFCHDFEVFGEVKGTINASGKLSVRSGAQVSGIINANSLSIFPGAVVNIDGNTTELPSDNT